MDERTGSLAVGTTATLTSYYESFAADGTPKSVAPQPIDAASQTSGQLGRETYSGHLGLAAAFSANGSLAYAYSDLTGISSNIPGAFPELGPVYVQTFDANLKALTPIPVQVSTTPIQSNRTMVTRRSSLGKGDGILGQGRQTA